MGKLIVLGVGILIGVVLREITEIFSDVIDDFLNSNDQEDQWQTSRKPL